MISTFEFSVFLHVCLPQLLPEMHLQLVHPRPPPRNTTYTHKLHPAYYNMIDQTQTQHSCSLQLSEHVYNLTYCMADYVTFPYTQSGLGHYY